MHNKDLIENFWYKGKNHPTVPSFESVYVINTASVFAGDPGLQSGEEGERIASLATPDSAKAASQTDEPGEAERESNSAKTGHVKVPQALAREAPLMESRIYALSGNGKAGSCIFKSNFI